MILSKVRRDRDVMNRQSLQAWIDRIWYGQSRWYVLLMPLSWLYGMLIGIRRRLYELGLLRTITPQVPVVVVGNITAGGTGKTPLTVWLAERLQERGWQPGIVARGYGGKVGPVPLWVNGDSDAAVVGDEALMIVRRLGCPVVVHPDRVAAANAVAALGADVVIADDGLQHSRLDRKFEIAVLDGARGFGNRRLLPAGPLREPISRLASVGKVLVQQDQDGGRVLQRKEDRSELHFRLVPTGVRSMHTGEEADLQSFAGKTVHAVAGIGNPQRFFRMLEAYGLQVIRHALPDHASISHADLNFDDTLDVVMTEKDAVKCGNLDTEKCWYVRVEPEFHDGHGTSLVDAVHLSVSPANTESNP